MQRTCNCNKLHVKTTCRDYREGRGCNYESDCHFGHDECGGDVRLRKAAEHRNHHLQWTSEQRVPVKKRTFNDDGPFVRDHEAFDRNGKRARRA